MGNEGGQRVGDDATDENQSVDWFANVLKTAPTENDVPTETSMVKVGQPSVAAAFSETGSDDSAGDRSGGGLRQIGSRIVSRYQHLPSWVLLPQIFLAAGWGRAAVAHALSRQWWNGQEVLDFLATDTDLQVGLYRHVLSGIVEPLPAVTALVVGLAEFGIAILLAANHRVKVALAVATFLNVQFILAGVVNPSIFYLVASLGIAIWRLETTASAETISRLTRVGAGLGFGVSLLLAPSVKTIKPEKAIEDPALVLIFLIALTAASLWWVNHRTSLASNTRTVLTEDDRLANQPRETPISMVWLAAAAVATVVILVAGFGVSAEGDEREVQAGPNDAAVGSESAELGSLSRPYAFGQDVTLSYDNPETGTLRQLQVQVMDALILDGDRLGLPSPTGDSRVALAQIRLTDRASDERNVDLSFKAIDQSGDPIPASTEGCGERAPLPRRGPGPDSSGEVEGWVCWWVAATDLRSVLLAVEAEPADGIVYMSLGGD